MRKVGIVGSSVYGHVAALAGAIVPMLAEPERIYPPKVYPENVRHQGAKERFRRIGQRDRGECGL